MATTDTDGATCRSRRALTQTAEVGLALRRRRIAGAHRRPRDTVGEQLAKDRLELRDRYADLVHGVPLADRDLRVAGLAALAVAHRLDVDGHAVGRADLVLAAVDPADRRGVVVHAHPPAREAPLDLAGPGDDLVPLLEERKDRDLDRSEVRVQAQQHPLLAPHLLLAVRVPEKRQHRPVR